jgi:NADPH:quinone reductase-like Zn-dependent oxidoreductase
MKAYAITARDTQPTLQDLPTPEPTAGEVLIEVEAASVNGFDLSVAAGYVWDMIPGIEFPVVLGRDLVGTVNAVGDGVEGISVGDRVAAVIPGMALGPKTGSFTEYVALAAADVTAVPDGVDAQHAAVIGLAGIAAHDAREALNIHAGETLLISGATGGVGSIATQFAVAAGATVIGTAQLGQEEEYVRGLGAAHTVDYTGDVPAAVKAIAPTGVDKIVHAAGDPTALATTLKGGGAMASTTGATVEHLGRDDVTLAPIMAAATAEKLAALLERVANGGLRVNIETAIPLERAPEAFAAFADGTLGKVLITR